MEREKFDDELRSVLLAHDDNHKPAFNKERTWNNTAKRNKRKWFVFTAAAALVAVVLSVLIAREPATQIVAAKPVKHKPSSEIPDTGLETPLSAPENTGVEKIVSDVVRVSPARLKTKLPDDAVAVAPQEQVITNQPQAKQEVAATQAAVTLVQIPVAEEVSFKVVFKRGKVAPVLKDVVIAKTDEKLLQFKPRNGIEEDAQYTVNTNPLKLTFKTNR